MHVLDTYMDSSDPASPLVSGHSLWQPINLLCFNIEGYTRNKNYLTTLLKKETPKIIFIQELWLAYADQKILSEDFPDYDFHVSTPDMFENSEDLILQAGHTWHGTAIAWHRDLQPYVAQLPVTHDRFTAIKISFTSTHTILAISLYAPTSGKDNEFLECLDFLSDFLSSESGYSSVIMGADSNCSSKSSRRRQLAWAKFLKDFNLQIKSTDIPTFHHHNGTSDSCIDYFITFNCPVRDLRQHCTIVQHVLISLEKLFSPIRVILYSFLQPNAA